MANFNAVFITPLFENFLIVLLFQFQEKTSKDMSAQVMSCIQAVSSKFQFKIN